MMLRARLSLPEAAGDRRRAGRRTLRLAISASRAGEWADTVIHDLTAHGMRIETAAALAIGERIAFELPETPAVQARIVWKSDMSFGCEFDSPVSQATVSAALLQAPFDHPDWALSTRLEEVDLGQDISAEAVARWHARFEQDSKASGDRLVGFRRGLNGRILAMIARGA